MRKRHSQDESSEGGGDDEISYHSYGTDEASSNRNLPRTSEVDNMSPVLEHGEDDADNDSKEKTLDEYLGSYDMAGGSEKLSRRSHEQDELESSQGLLLQDFPQNYSFDEHVDVKEAAAVAPAAQEKAAEESGGGGVGMAVAAVATGGIAAVGTFLKKHSDEVTDDDNGDNDDSQYEDQDKDHEFLEGSVEMDDMTNPTLNPEIQRLHEDGVITRAEFEQMKQADRQFRHGPISMAESEQDGASEDAERSMAEDDRQHLSGSDDNPAEAEKKDSIKEVTQLVDSANGLSLDIYDDSLTSLDNTIMAEEAAKLRKEIEMELDQESDDESGGVAVGHEDEDKHETEGMPHDNDRSPESSIDDADSGSDDINDLNNRSLSDDGNGDGVRGLSNNKLGGYLLDEARPDDVQSLGILMDKAKSTRDSNEKKDVPAPIVEEDDNDSDEEDVQDAAHGMTSSAASLSALDLSQIATSDLFEQGEMFLEKGAVQKARLCFDKLVDDEKEQASGPETAQMLFDIAHKFLECGYAEKSISYFQAIPALNEEDPNDVEDRLLRVGSAFLRLDGKIQANAKR